MKLRTKLLIPCAGLASLLYGGGPAKADWAITGSPAPGYPVQNADGGTGSASFEMTITGGVVSPPSVVSNESSTGSGYGAIASPDYGLQGNIVYTWDTMGPPPQLKLKFSAQASASFSNNSSSSWGHAEGGASTSAASVAASAYSNGTPSNSSPTSQTVTFPNAFTHSFSMSANSSAYGYVYGSGGSFTTSSSSTMGYGS